MTERARQVVRRPGVGVIEYDPKLLGDIPDDYATKLYVIAALVDPADPTKPAAQWFDLLPYLQQAGLQSGWGYHGTYIMGTL